MAMTAYRGIFAGCRMDNSINKRSLMTGNVSTEESRKEIRKSPGAPRPPANATIFCFHGIKTDGKSSPHSERFSSPGRHAALYRTQTPANRLRRAILKGMPDAQRRIH